MSFLPTASGRSRKSVLQQQRRKIPLARSTTPAPKPTNTTLISIGTSTERPTNKKNLVWMTDAQLKKYKVWKEQQQKKQQTEVKLKKKIVLKSMVDKLKKLNKVKKTKTKLLKDVIKQVKKFNKTGGSRIPAITAVQQKLATKISAKISQQTKHSKQIESRIRKIEDLIGNLSSLQQEIRQYNKVAKARGDLHRTPQQRQEFRKFMEVDKQKEGVSQKILSVFKELETLRKNPMTDIHYQQSLRNIKKTLLDKKILKQQQQQQQKSSVVSSSGSRHAPHTTFDRIGGGRAFVSSLQLQGHDAYSGVPRR